MATQCPVTREQFEREAKPLEIVVDGNKIVAPTKVFQLGSFGWHAQQKIAVLIGGQVVSVQVNLLFTCVGSKPK